MNWRRVLSVIRKEWWHITRDRTSFVLLLLSPVLALVTMAYAFSIDIKHVGIGVLNQDLSSLSRQYLAQLGSTDALRVEAWPQSLDEVEQLMMHGSVKAVVVIPRGFAQDLKAGRTAALQIVKEAGVTFLEVGCWVSFSTPSPPTACGRDWSRSCLTITNTSSKPIT